MDKVPLEVWVLIVTSVIGSVGSLLGFLAMVIFPDFRRAKVESLEVKNDVELAESLKTSLESITELNRVLFNNFMTYIREGSDRERKQREAAEQKEADSAIERAELNRRITDLEAQMANNEDRIQEVQNKLDTAQKALKDTEEALDAARTRIAYLENELKKQSELYSTLRKDYDDLKKRHDQLQTKYNSLQSDHEQLKQDHRLLQDTYDRAIKERAASTPHIDPPPSQPSAD